MDLDSIIKEVNDSIMKKITDGKNDLHTINIMEQEIKVVIELFKLKTVLNKNEKDYANIDDLERLKMFDMCIAFTGMLIDIGKEELKDGKV